MLVKDLIAQLQEYDGNKVVDCNNCHGTYSSILGVKFQRWTDREGNEHEVITIMHDGYNSEDSLVKN